MLMIDYLDEHAIDHMGNFIRVVGKSGNAFEASTPSQRWMTFILNVQCKLHDIVDRHEELHPPLSIASTSAYLQPFERALGRVQPRVHEVINLYERFSAHLLRYIFHMKQRDAQGAGRSFVYVPIVKIHYMRLMKLMHEQLSVAEFCERVKTINSDMALFGVGPNLTGIVHGLAGCIDFWQVAKDAFARGAQDLASRAVDAAFRR